MGSVSGFLSPAASIPALALNLLKFGAEASLFVYGDSQDEDVRIARLICKAEGLPWKSSTRVLRLLSRSLSGETGKRIFFAFDGWKVRLSCFSISGLTGRTG